MYDYSTFLGRLVVQVGTQIRSSRNQFPSFPRMCDSIFLLLKHLSVVFIDPGREKILAPIVRYKNANNLVQLSAVLVSLDEFDNLFLRYAYALFTYLYLRVYFPFTPSPPPMFLVIR